MNLVDLLRERVRTNPTSMAVVDAARKERWSYKQLLSEVETTASSLLRAGLTSGQSMGLHCASGRDYIVLTYAAWHLGCCVTPIPVELAGPEKTRIATEIGMDVIVTDPLLKTPFKGLISKSGTRLGTRHEVFQTLASRPHPNGFSELNPAFLRFTSGTTGTCKGVILSHETIFERIQAANDVLQISSSDRVLWLLSMSYHFAVSIVSYLSIGATIILCENHFGDTIVQTTEQERGTFIYGSPLHFEFMAGDRSGRQLPDLRMALSTTTAQRPETAQRFQKRFGIPLGQAYGIIEVGLPCIRTTWSPAAAKSVGNILPAYEMRFKKDANGSDSNEILVRGPGIFDAYYQPFTRRDEVMKDGWFHTGDLGKMDAAGNVFITGRSKDMHGVGGMKFFPQEIEDVLREHPGVLEVRAYAFEDPELGELPRAQVTLKNPAAPPSEKELRNFCKQRLAPYKIPQVVTVVERLPRSAAGKLIRRLQRERNPQKGASV